MAKGQAGAGNQPDKSKVVNLKRQYSDFLGFKLKVRKKGKKYVVRSHMSDKAYKKVKASLTKQVGNIKFPRKGRGEAGKYGCSTPWLWESRITTS